MTAATHLSGALGYALLFGLGAFLLVIAVSVRSFVRSTHDFVIAGRRIGLGFGVGSVIAVWTWSMAVLMSSAQAFSWGTSGLIWFIVPNGLAVVAVVPFALKLRKHMPHGYTIVEFIRARFSSRTATIVILAAQIFGLLSEIFINLFGVVLVTGVIFGLNPTAVLLVTLADDHDLLLLRRPLDVGHHGDDQHPAHHHPGSARRAVRAGEGRRARRRSSTTSTPRVATCSTRSRRRRPPRSASRWRSACWPRPSRTRRSGRSCGPCGPATCAARSSGVDCGSTRSRSRSACSAWSVSASA